jgi:excisionase family DNA binding protein
MVLIEEERLVELMQNVIATAVGEAIKKALEPEFLTTAQASKLFSISPRTLVGWRTRKIIPFVRISGRVLFRVTDLKEFVSTHTIRKRTDGTIR